MTVSECKKDVAARLEKAGVAFSKLTARTVSFEGLGYGCTVFVKIHGIPNGMLPNRKEIFADVPKPSQGGYCTEVAGAMFS